MQLCTILVSRHKNFYFLWTRKMKVWFYYNNFYKKWLILWYIDVGIIRYYCYQYLPKVLLLFSTFTFQLFSVSIVFAETICYLVSRHLVGAVFYGGSCIFFVRIMLIDSPSHLQCCKRYYYQCNNRLRSPKAKYPNILQSYIAILVMLCWSARKNTTLVAKPKQYVYSARRGGGGRLVTAFIFILRSRIGYAIDNHLTKSF
jgi:hypothetical protein